jgi:protein-S-isoprenylcysteine O-methyltransferase Ste14
MTPVIAKYFWLACVVAWWIVRFPYERRARKAKVRASQRDARELILLGISLTGLGIIPIIYVFTGFPASANRSFIPWVAWIGVVPALGSLWLFWRTHKELGRNWSVSLEVRDKHELVTNGVYRYVRHPMYSAFFLWAVAQLLLLPNWVAGVSGLIGFGTLFSFRVGREEQLMLEAFGEQYRAYMARTARIIPWVF